MATGLLNANASSVTLECNGVTAMIAKDTGVVAAGAAGVSGNDLVTVGQLGLSKYYESPEQTITSAGSITLPHSMGVEPVLLQGLLVCKTAQSGFSAGEKVFITVDTQESAVGRGMSIVPDATNLTIKYGNNANVVVVINKSTGTADSCTNANWRLVVRAWA